MKETFGEKVFNVVNKIILIILCMIMLYPIMYVFGRSFMNDVERAARPFAVLPIQWDFIGYKYIFASGSYLMNAYGVTIVKTLVGTVCNVIFTAMFAYVLASKEYPLRKFLTMAVTFTMWFGGGLIPTFLLIKSLGLYNNFWVYILPGLITAWNMLILRNFFMQIPYSLVESAKIDGADEIKIFYKIILPLSTPAIATIALFYAVGHWNSWFDSMIYISNRKLWVIQVFLREIVRNANVNDITQAAVEFRPPSQNVVLATIVVATVPILCVYPFVQKYFVKGMTVGAVKG